MSSLEDRVAAVLEKAYEDIAPWVNMPKGTMERLAAQAVVAELGLAQERLDRDPNGDVRWVGPWRSASPAEETS